MAEGGTEEESEMLGPATVPHQSPSGLNVVIKAEMAQPVISMGYTSASTPVSQESDRESSVGSPEPASTMGVDGSTDLHIGGVQKMAHGSRADEPSDQKISPSVSSTAHLNGTMAGLVTLQNLQNLATLQQSLPQVASLAAGLQSMANLSSGNSSINAPLNLSVGASAAATPRSSTTTQSTVVGAESPLAMSTTTNSQQQQQHSTIPQPAMLTNQQHQQQQQQHQQPAPMPQFILASGQLVQGIQGAQLLIPTSQGLATQTILTIPVNHVNSSDQMVNLALNNGQVVQTSLANLQAMAQGQTNLMPPTNNTIPTSNGTNSIAQSLLNPATLSHLLSNGSAQQLLQSLPQLLNNAHPPPPQPLLNPLTQPLLTPPSTLLSTPLTQSPAATQSQSTVAAQSHRNQHTIQSQLNPNHYPESKLHQSSLNRNASPPNSASSMNTINRLSATNGELTITTSLGPNSSQNLKRSPSLSPSCNDSSTADLLIDSPNQPTINQTSSNVVDGINLDEIKDFAKAFKLRRLSLGLTQTQVGQALSVTEGPAYSQSAICSALASQMFAAAQLSSQQQAMFEKLDITPKSAQKIKPVLERWMKEAEDRYKSGQNHLTDFIGIEPSKKRKRRTSFTPQALELLNAHFERNTHPSGTEITGLAHQLGYEREVIRIWFCNKRQALKNTVRMMSKGMV